ncbi:UPF0481 protein At3g47200-like [Prunus avium]|uniref:UPF0481 protein At3g47200-like n=1 Tax=Prunus avium TaxID=42229 RepID=A0A6P5T0J0_PRUAV|nr:UPF0481 protein At3g47200-like [Prunus avium]
MTTPNSNESDDSLDTNKDGEGSVSAAQNENGNADELLSISLIEKLKKGSDPFSVHRCIYKIPNVLRKQNEKAFIPSVVSIGPFHHGKENLKGMEKIKLHYLRSLLIDRKPPLETKMEDLVKGIRPIESACRDCYGEKVDLSDDEFVEMMVIDGCFILEFLRRCTEEVSPVDGDLIFSNAGILWEVMNDLLLLENQLPWRVLECLFDLTGESAMFPLPMLILNVLKSYVLLQSPKPSGKLKNRHLLDFIRNSLLGSYEQSQSDDDSIVSDLIPSVTVLRQAGVKFECGKEEDNSMLNITFKNGVLEIPPILVLEENRESLFGNLIAYEQCQPSLGYQITSYVVVLDNLIKSNKDVEFLVEKKIMRKILSKDVACFFSRVYKDNRLYNFEYLELQKQVNTFCAGGWHKWKMILRRYYFKNPCSSCSSSS